MTGMRVLNCLGFVAAFAGCSLITVKQDPFPALAITAERPPPGPPRVVLTPSSIEIHEKVQFETGSAVLLPGSNGLLTEVAQMLIDNPQITKIQIEGHTDITGGAARNRTLASGRAKSVIRFLVTAGVSRKRMIAKGFGPDRPMAGNDTEEGREMNRRVEFNIVEQGPKKTLVHED